MTAYAWAPTYNYEKCGYAFEKREKNTQKHMLNEMSYVNSIDAEDAVGCLLLYL